VGTNFRPLREKGKKGRGTDKRKTPWGKRGGSTERAEEQE